MAADAFTCLRRQFPGPAEELAHRQRQGVLERGQVQGGGPAGELRRHHHGHCRAGRDAFLEDDRSGEQVPEPLGPPGDQHADHSRDRQQRAGPLHHGAEQGTDERVTEPDRPAVVPYDPQPHGRLADTASPPQGLRRRRVADHDQHHDGQIERGRQRFVTRSDGGEGGPGDDYQYDSL